MPRKFTYGKNERLKSRKLIQLLFNEGKYFYAPPLKIFYLQPDKSLDFAVKAGFGVSSRNFKSAHQRNRIKRLLREAYRINKYSLYDFISSHQKEIVFFMLYSDREMPAYENLERTMHLALEKLINQLHEQTITNT